MEALILGITIASGYLIYRVTNFSLGLDEKFYDRPHRLHGRASYYSDYADAAHFLNDLKIPPTDKQRKTTVYFREIPGARKWEIDMGMGAYFIIDHRQYEEIMRYKQNFDVVYETHIDKQKFHGKPTTTNQPSAAPKNKFKSAMPSHKYGHKNDTSHHSTGLGAPENKEPEQTPKEAENLRSLFLQQQV